MISLIDLKSACHGNFSTWMVIGYGMDLVKLVRSDGWADWESDENRRARLYEKEDSLLLCNNILLKFQGCFKIPTNTSTVIVLIYLTSCGDKYLPYILSISWFNPIVEASPTQSFFKRIIHRFHLTHKDTNQKKKHSVPRTRIETYTKHTQVDYYYYSLLILKSHTKQKSQTQIHTDKTKRRNVLIVWK